MHRSWRIVCLPLALLLFACPLLSRSFKRHHGFREIPPFQLPSGVKVKHNLVYARYGERLLHLDLYRPATGAGPFPGVLFIHGGGWSGGPLIQFRRQAAYLATQGFVAVTIEYRLAPENPYPASIFDCKAAVRWLRANAMKYKIDPHKIAAVGGSAGGHLAAMLGTTAGIRTLEGNGGNPQYSSRVQAVVAFNGIYDLVSIVERSPADAPIDLMVERFLEGPLQSIPEVYIEASPISHVCKDSAPFLMLHGTADTTSPYRQALEMQKALENVGVRANLFTAKGANHGFFNWPPYYRPTLESMVRFLQSVLATTRK